MDEEQYDEDESTGTPFRWTDVFSRSSVPDRGFAVRDRFQSHVKDFVKEYGANLNYHYLGGMLSYGGESWTADLLDGEFVLTSGVMFRYGPMSGNGEWLSGYKAVRLVLYTFSLKQPRGWPGEGPIPSYEALVAEAAAAREKKSGSWKWD